MIGFYLDYRRTDTACAALQAAAVLERHGADVDVFPARGPAAIGCEWDRRVQRSARLGPVSWFAGCDRVIFFQAPPESLVTALSAGKVETTAVFLSSLTEEEIDRLCLFDNVVAPAQSTYRHLRKSGTAAKAIRPLQWDLGLPHLRGDCEVDPERLALLWYLDGSQAELQSASVIPVIGEILKLQHVYVTVLFNDRLDVGWLARLRELQFRAEGRLELARVPQLGRQVTIAADHDLLVWPSMWEDFGVPGMLAMTAGLPMVAYDHPVIAEFIKDNYNGVLVPCELASAPVSPIVIYDHPAFKDTLHQLLTTPERLQDLRVNAHAIGLERQRRFEEGLIALLFDSASSYT